MYGGFPDCDICRANAAQHYYSGTLYCQTCFFGGPTPDKKKAPPAPTKPAEPPDVDDEDPVTRRLINDALKTHGRRGCPVCGYRGHFIRAALVCDLHGPFAGI